VQPFGWINGARALALIVGLIVAASCATQKSHTLSKDGVLPLPHNLQIETSSTMKSLARNEDPGPGGAEQAAAVFH